MRGPAMAASLAVRSFCCGVLIRRVGRRWSIHPGYLLPDQFLDCGDSFRIVPAADQGDRGAGPSGAAGAADTMNVIVGVVRYVEIVNVAHGGNIEAARGDVGCNQ